MVNDLLPETRHNFMIDEHHLAWGRSVLGLETGAEVDDIQAIALNALEKSGFTSNEALDHAVKYLAGKPETLWTPTDRLHWEQLNEAQVEVELRSFFSRYLGFPPKDRKREYERLRPLCQPHLRLKRLLEHLERGLDINPEINHLGSVHLKYLGKCILNSYVTWPTEKGDFYREKIDVFFDKPNEWQAESQKLRRIDPKLASLGGDWFDELLHSDNPNHWHRKYFPDVIDPEWGGTWTHRKKEFVVSRTCVAFVAIVLLAGSVLFICFC